MYRILIVDDDISINGMLQKLLEQNQYDVQVAFSGTEALLLLEKCEFDLIILDLMLPGLSGEQVLDKIRGNSSTPVIGLSAKDDMRCKINLLRNGADDYITKPFDTGELLARIEVVLRRVYESDFLSAKVLHCGELSLNVLTMKVLLRNKEIQLTKNEFAILNMLMERPKQVFTKDMIYEKIWNEHFEGTENAINVHISNLRKKLAAVDDSRSYIKTVWGIGFKMET